MSKHTALIAWQRQANESLAIINTVERTLGALMAVC